MYDSKFRLIDRWSVIAVGALIYLLGSSGSVHAEQCVIKDGSYVAAVDWYRASDIIIDNSEPWNNRLLIRRSKSRGSEKCGVNMSTGELVCRGSHVSPIKSATLSTIGGLANPALGRSCVEGSGNFAIISCKGCTQGLSLIHI